MRSNRNLQYFIREGCYSFMRNGLMSVASTVIVVASLIVLGVYLLISMNINYLAQQLTTGYEIQAWIADETDATQFDLLEQQITALENVRKAEFFSKEEALRDFAEQLGDDADSLAGFDEDNPLRNSFKVRLKQLDRSEETAAEIGALPGIASVSNNQAAASKIVQITSLFRVISFWFVIFLSLLAVFIISNTIRITLFARRRDINIMKYLGATNSFISWPYIIEGIMIGLVGALMALLVVAAGYAYILQMDNSWILGDLRFCSLPEVLPALAGWFAGIGVVLGAAGSAVSIQRHLNV